MNTRPNPNPVEWGALAALGAVILTLSYASRRLGSTTPRQPPPPLSALPSAGQREQDSTAIREVQTKLLSLGYGPISITGAWDRDTAYAIARLQQREGIRPANGILNGETAAKLVEVYERKTGQREAAFAASIYMLFLAPILNPFGTISSSPR